MFFLFFLPNVYGFFTDHCNRDRKGTNQSPVAMRHLKAIWRQADHKLEWSMMWHHKKEQPRRSEGEKPTTWSGAWSGALLRRNDACFPREVQVSVGWWTGKRVESDVLHIWKQLIPRLRGTRSVGCIGWKCRLGLGQKWLEWGELRYLITLGVE